MSINSAKQDAAFKKKDKTLCRSHIFKMPEMGMDASMDA